MQGTVVAVKCGKKHISNTYIKLKNGAVYGFIGDANTKSEILGSFTKAQIEGRSPTVKLDRNLWRKMR